MVEITSEEQNKVKRMKRAEDSLRDLWDNMKCTNIRIIGVPEEEEKKGMRKIFNYNLFKNFLIPFLFLFFFWNPYNLNVGMFGCSDSDILLLIPFRVFLISVIVLSLYVYSLIL